ncbi:MAG TPA: YkgJ family cysteine cluster protein [Gallionellaceae bacterium]
MSTQIDENLCQRCGACCSNFRVSFYHGELDDMPFGIVPAALTEKLNDTRACMKGTNQKQPRCIALSGTPGVHTACTIYAQRPTPCREFNAWDAHGQPIVDCQRLRAGLGLPELTPLAGAE